MWRKVVITSLAMIVAAALHCHSSVLRATDNVSELVSGLNLLAIGVYQDSLGSTDVTLIARLLADAKVVIDEGSPVRYIEPRSDIPSKRNLIGWAMPGFDDSRWKKGVFGVGYGDGDDNTVVGSKEKTRSIYTRAYFNISDPSRIRKLTLKIDYDDSVVVWLNGVEVARSLPTELPKLPHWNSQCGEKNTHEASKQNPPRYESVNLKLGKDARRSDVQALGRDVKKKAKKSAQDQLASEVKGAVVYSRNRHIYKVVIGKWKPIELGAGEYARWSPDGKKIAAYDRRKIYVMNADGNNRKLVTGEAWQKSGCPIEFHTNGREIIFIRRNKRGLWAVNISNGKMRKLADFHDYTGEPGISADGKRMACRSGSDVWAIDLARKRDFRYAKGVCASGVSPDGKWLMNNLGEHKTMSIRSWDGKDKRVLRASICRPDGSWDNHHWSNHNDYICAEGDGKECEAYVIKVSAKRGTRVTWDGGVVYPDLYVQNAAKGSISGWLSGS